MMTRPTRYPVAAFGPELMAALLKGARERVVIPMENAREIMWLQQRLHMLRGAMGKEKHPSYTLVQRARTSRQWDEPEGTPRTGKPTKSAKNFRLVIEPNDIQFRDAFEKAGISLGQETLDNVEEILEETPNETPTDPSTEPTAAPSTEEGIDPYASFKQ